MTTPEVNSLRASGYNPRNQYEHNDIIRKAMDALGQGFNGKTFQNLHQALLNVDQYMALADFASYSHAQQKAEQLYKDQTKWNSMSLVNTAKAGIFRCRPRHPRLCEHHLLAKSRSRRKPRRKRSNISLCKKQGAAVVVPCFFMQESLPMTLFNSRNSIHRSPLGAVADGACAL